MTEHGSQSDGDDPRLGERARGAVGRTTAAYGAFRARWFALPLLLTVTFAILLVLPFGLELSVLGVSLGGVVTLQTVILTLVWATAAQSWNITSGYAGQFSFGHAAFFGLGAYVPILLIREFGINPWIGLVAGGAIAAVYGLVIGGLCFRFDIGGNYFALATLAFAELLRYVFFNAPQLGGASGYVKPLPREYAGDYGLMAFQFTSDFSYYYVIVLLLGIVTIVSLLVRHSRFGLHLLAIRNDERAAAALGVPTFRYKLASFVASAFFTAWAGSFWAMYFSSIRPEVVFDLTRNIEILLPAVVGGFGTVLGPIVGSFAVTPTAEFARQLAALPGVDWIVYGAFLIVVALSGQAGLVSWPGRLADAIGPARQSTEDE